MQEHEILDKICRRMVKSYTVPGFQSTDIYQEAYLIGLEVLKKYTPERGPLENYLNVSINNRFLNLIRARSVAAKSCGCSEHESCKKCLYRDSKANVIFMRQMPEDVDFIDGYETSQEKFDEILPIIDEKLPVGMRDDWRRLRDGVRLSPLRKSEIISTIQDILVEDTKVVDENYEYGWEGNRFYIENEEHLALLDMCEDMDLLSAQARQVYLKIKEGVEISQDEIKILAKDVQWKI